MNINLDSNYDTFIVVEYITFVLCMIVVRVPWCNYSLVCIKKKLFYLFFYPSKKKLEFFFTLCFYPFSVLAKNVGILVI